MPVMLSVAVVAVEVWARGLPSVRGQSSEGLAGLEPVVSWLTVTPLRV